MSDTDTMVGPSQAEASQIHYLTPGAGGASERGILMNAIHGG